jgi:hypothetical protein
MQLYAFCYNNATSNVVLLQKNISSILNTPTRKEVVLTQKTTSESLLSLYFPVFSVSDNLCVLGKKYFHFLDRKEGNHV